MFSLIQHSQRPHTWWLFHMHEISCKELRWFVLISTGKLQYNPKIMPCKNFFLHQQEEVLLAADCGSLEQQQRLLMDILSSRTTILNVRVSIYDFLLFLDRLAMQFVQENNLNYWPTPAESPDMNPIELLWHKLKNFLRTVVKPKTRTNLSLVFRGSGKL